MKIKFFENFEELRIEMGSPLEIIEKDFQIFKYSDVSHARLYMPPYRRAFYQITLIENFGNTEISINDYNLQESSDLILFVSPEQVLSWVRDKAVEGYMIYFKDDFLNLASEPLNKEFSFFNAYDRNIIELHSQEIQIMRDLFSDLYLEQNLNKNKSRRPILQHLLSILLHRCQDIYEKYLINNPHTREENLASIFKRYVDNHYHEVKTINEYADLMNLSSNYLSQVIKNQTGESAKTILDKRIILEAKNMITYTEMSISQVAYSLGFSEPTHFSRLFKKYVKESPRQYRLTHGI